MRTWRTPSRWKERSYAGVDADASKINRGHCLTELSSSPRLAMTDPRFTPAGRSKPDPFYQTGRDVSCRTKEPHTCERPRKGWLRTCDYTGTLPSVKFPPCEGQAGPTRGLGSGRPTKVLKRP